MSRENCTCPYTGGVHDTFCGSSNEHGLYRCVGCGNATAQFAMSHAKCPGCRKKDGDDEPFTIEKRDGKVFIRCRTEAEAKEIQRWANKMAHQDMLSRPLVSQIRQHWPRIMPGPLRSSLAQSDPESSEARPPSS